MSMGPGLASERAFLALTKHYVASEMCDRVGATFQNVLPDPGPGSSYQGGVTLSHTKERQLVTIGPMP